MNRRHKNLAKVGFANYVDFKSTLRKVGYYE